MPGLNCENILLPIDLGHESSWAKALPAAADLARLYGATLHVLTVIPDVGMPVVGAFFPADFAEQAHRKAQDALAAWMNDHMEQDVTAQAHVRSGTIYDEIIAAADEIGAEMIVMASHRPQMRDYLLGPNAARVVRHARQHVCVVRSE